jgi:hypothetical protein
VTRRLAAINRGLVDLSHAPLRLASCATPVLRDLDLPTIRNLVIPLSLTSTSQLAQARRCVTALVRRVTGSDGLGVCVVCGEPVGRNDPFLRYRGEYYHGATCVESRPPALERAPCLPTGPRSE